jgi:hypothetical protein
MIRRNKLSTMAEIILEELQHSPTSVQNPIDPMNKNTRINGSQDLGQEVPIPSNIALVLIRRRTPAVRSKLAASDKKFTLHCFISASCCADEP